LDLTYLTCLQHTIFCDEGLALHSETAPVTIALTGFGRLDDKARVKAAGFDHHPVEPADISLVQQIISQSEKLF
jgi:CheY-like chemotaxis protein